MRCRARELDGDNAAVLEGIQASRLMTAIEQRATEVSGRGGVKATSLGGMILRNKDKKEGEQDKFQWLFAKVLGYDIRAQATRVVSVTVTVRRQQKSLLILMCTVSSCRGCAIARTGLGSITLNRTLIRPSRRANINGDVYTDPT